MTDVGKLRACEVVGVKLGREKKLNRITIECANSEESSQLVNELKDKYELHWDFIQNDNMINAFPSEPEEMESVLKAINKNIIPDISQNIIEYVSNAKFISSGSFEKRKEFVSSEWEGMITNISDRIVKEFEKKGKSLSPNDVSQIKLRLLQNGRNNAIRKIGREFKDIEKEKIMNIYDEEKEKYHRKVQQKMFNKKSLYSNVDNEPYKRKVNGIDTEKILSYGDLKYEDRGKEERKRRIERLRKEMNK